MLALAFIAMFILFVVFATDDAYAHGAHGGFGGRQPDYLLALVMTSTAAFGFIALIVKRIGFRLSLGLLFGSLSVLMISLSEQTRIEYGFLDAFTLEYYNMLPYLIVVSFIGTIGGSIFTAYHFWAVRPYLNHKIT